MKRLAKEFLRKTHLEAAAREVFYRVMLLKRRMRGLDEAMLADCGAALLEGWLNSDLVPKLSSVMHLDATRPFPIESNQFEYIFSQHIEHISYSDGLHMLKECCRVLKKRGKIRIATLDLRFLVSLYNDEKSALQKRYIEWSINRHIVDAPYYDAVFVLNNYFRDWGHTFIYDENSLRKSLEAAGFSSIVKCGLHQVRMQRFEPWNAKIRKTSSSGSRRLRWREPIICIR